MSFRKQRDSGVKSQAKFKFYFFLSEYTHEKKNGAKEEGHLLTWTKLYKDK